ncbi:COX17-domain-containing protein [Mycena venus]|uniref:COX17-domain-containing protein n=1 Tax=Mycena venus TaxID=2733690 RepID=A0A8H6YEH1_9AGAR|nr:COX17-domain-containing protein [Mycena venus]
MFEKITSLWSSKPEPLYDPTNPKLNPLNPQGLKPCCACPETKSARDDCFLNASAGEADDKCKQLVQNHLACMRGLGFKI